MHSQLLGLKSQMNPHFLFNSLNTLSSLINEDPEKGEEFLDHMTKVYRYLLRNNEEQLVSLQTELNFLHSYYFILKARHTEGLEVHFDIPDEYLDCRIPPLTLQMILENALNSNSVSRSTPLSVTISVNEDGLQIRNTLQPKMSTPADGEALENITNKFRLLCQKELIVRSDIKERCIILPLITNNADA
jgi:two-component system, LytTR family, sensor kinase